MQTSNSLSIHRQSTIKSLLKCDPDGVPSLVQRMFYRREDMIVDLLFFDNSINEVPVEDLCEEVAMVQPEPTPLQWEAIEANAYMYWPGFEKHDDPMAGMNALYQVEETRRKEFAKGILRLSMMNEMR